ncbi:MAG: DNA polymerase III subunit alpha [Chloroflexia bacterium]
MGFAHLHCHTGYSLLEGTAMPDALVAAAKRLKMPALAITDRNNLYGVVDFYLHAVKAGVKPVIGMEVDLDDGHSLVLLARNMDGYRNLCHLATVLRLNCDPDTLPPAGFEEDDEILPWEPGVWGVPVFGFTDGGRGYERQRGVVGGRAPRVAWNPEPRPPPADAHTPDPRKKRSARLPAGLLLSGRHVRGLVALSGGRGGLINSLVARGKMQQASRAAGMLLSAFGEGNFFIELTALDACDLEVLPRLSSLAADLGIPIVATNDVLYMAPEDASTAAALAVARSRSERMLGAGSLPMIPAPTQSSVLSPQSSGECYFKTPEQMAELFKEYPQAIANASFIAEQCAVELPLHKPLFPSVDLRPGESPFSRLWKLCFAGATRLYRPLTGPVVSRLNYELEVIESLGFSAYFLVVYDIAHFARSNDIPIMARGSAADSLVAYVLGITQVDPLANDLLFERFLSPSRAEFELPDIDLDLCWRRRDEVLHYVYQRYGRDHVSIVGTHITFRLRSAWREMAKALGIHPDRISYIASKLPYFSSEDLLNEENEEAPVEAGELENSKLKILNSKLSEEERKAFDLCQSIEKLPRHAGMHCGGVVITPGPIADLVPLQRAARDPDLAVTQFDKDAIESMGLVKMDLLGSRALTTLVDSLQSSGLAAGTGDVHRCLETIPFGDERTYRMIASGDTLGCFQLESPGMRGLLKWLRPHSLDEIAISISLFRPGPLEGGFLDIFMRRHLGQEPVAYPHPSMEPILKDTKGVILFQEQFLKLAHALAGMELGEAEKLRKDLGKARTPEERTRLGSWFVAGAIERGIDQLQAEKVWEVIAGYSGFGFCKAHACSYALTAYRSAYMKAHYPAHYLAAQINNQGGYYGPAVYVEDARRLRIDLLPPHVNAGGALCEVSQGKRAIRIGLQFVKGLSERAIAALLLERRQGGPFRSLPDLISRVEMCQAELTSLIKVGACDDLGDPAAIPSIAPLRGHLGESIGAVREVTMNRKQMLALLPAILAGVGATARGLARRSRPGATVVEARATGSEGASMQLLMGDFMQHGSQPKVLGKGTMRLEVPALEDYTPAEKLRLEQEVMGFAVSRNEMELYAAAIKERNIVLQGDLARHAEREVTVAGVVVAGRRHQARDGEWMLFLSLQDTQGLIEVVLFPEAYKKAAETLSNCGHGPYMVKGHVQVTGKGRGIGVQPPSDLRPSEALTLKMHPVIIATTLEPFSP